MNYPGSLGIEKEKSGIHQHNLFVIIDGVGRDYLGAKATALANRTIIESFFNHFKENNSPDDAIVFSLKEANRVILQERLDIKKKMAASVCIFYIRDKIMYFSHLGDSRIYLIQDNELNQLTRDHTLREEDPFAEKRYNDPRALQALIKGLGIHEEPEIYLKRYPLEKKSRIILTTERLTERVSNRDLQWLSRKIKNPKKLGSSIVELFRRKGGSDEFTLGIIRYGVSPKWLKKILIIYSISFLFILTVISGYYLKYGGDDTPERKVAVRQPILIKKKSVSPTEKITKVSQKTGNDLSDQIHSFLGEWKNAWEMSAGKTGDIEAYISFYSKDYRSGRFDKNRWKLDKSRKNKRKKWINVKISNVKISDPDRNGNIKVRFSQGYRSSNYSVVSTKVLLLKKENNNWAIISEKSS